VRRSSMALKGRWRCGPTAKPQKSEKEALHPVRRAAHLRSQSFSLMTVGHAHSVGLIGVPDPATHAPKATQRTPTKKVPAGC
jgi:hypothetical protein